MEEQNGHTDRDDRVNERTKSADRAFANYVHLCICGTYNSGDTVFKNEFIDFSHCSFTPSTVVRLVITTSGCSNENNHRHKVAEEMGR